MLLTDLPYLEPLLLHLRKDESLKQHFTDKSFFMPHSDLLSAAEESMKKDCPAPRALWILPQDTIAQGRKPNCKVPGIHTFFITIFVQCIRDEFQLVNRNGVVKLEGQFMSLVELRKLVKESVLRFGREQSMSLVGKKFDNISWSKDQMIYPDEGNFLATAIEFEVTIF